MDDIMPYVRALRAAPTFDAVAQRVLQHLARCCAADPASLTVRGGALRMRADGATRRFRDGDGPPLSAAVADPAAPSWTDDRLRLPLRHQGAVIGMIELVIEQATPRDPARLPPLLARLCDRAELAIDLLRARWETPGDGPALRRALHRAAALFLDAREQDPRLRLEQAGHFRHYVERAAVARYGGKSEAYRRLGRDTAVRRANHHRDYRTALERAEELDAILGERQPS